MGRAGIHINPMDLFTGGIPFEGDIDVDWFCDIQNAHVAEKRLEWLSTARNIGELMDRGYGGDALNRMWRSVYRACIGHDIPLTPGRAHHAESLGIVVPDQE